MQNSIYKIKYLLFLSWNWEAWCLNVWGVIPTPPPEINKGRKFFHCLGAPNNLIRPWIKQTSAEKRSQNANTLTDSYSALPNNTESISKDCNLLSYFEPNRNAPISAQAPLTCGVSHVCMRPEKCHELGLFLPLTISPRIINSYARQKQTKRCRPEQRFNITSHTATCFVSHEMLSGTSLYNN